MSQSTLSFFDIPEKPKNHKWTWSEFKDGVIDEDECLQRFKEWKDTPVYVGIIQEGINKLSFFRAKKRGDKAYCNSVISKVVTSVKNFSMENSDWRLWKFLTLTTKATGEISYKVVREAWNRLLTNLKYYAKKKGRQIKVLRVFELQKRGSVHIHVILYGLLYVPKKKLLQMWGVGWTDIRACRNVGQLVGYVSKYLTKSIKNDHITKWFWMWHSRQWSMTFPIRLDSKSLSQKNSRKKWGVGAIWWGGGVSVGLQSFISEGYKGLVYWIKQGDYEHIALLMTSILNELKQNHKGS